MIVGEDEDGNSYNSREKLEAVFSDTDSLATIIKNLTSFVKENKLDGDYLNSLLAALGVDAAGILSLIFK